MKLLTSLTMKSYYYNIAVFFMVLFLGPQQQVEPYAVPCNPGNETTTTTTTTITTRFCESKVGQGSICRNDGFCSNPFESGCLYAMLPQWNKTRVCNSDDDNNDNDAAASQRCRSPTTTTTHRIDDDDDEIIPYTEIRIWAGLWESSNFEAWLVQIILSELLDVPTTTETGLSGQNMNFYNEINKFEYGLDQQVIPSVQNSYKYSGNCNTQQQQQENEENDSYESCSHYVPEIWNDLVSIDEGKFLLDNGIVEPPQAMGVMGKEGWFVTKFTIQDNPSLISYYGMQGLDDTNRLRLAETFLRPTTWKEYCELISTNNCSSTTTNTTTGDDNDGSGGIGGDGVAVRAPQDETEMDRMFVEGLYQGYFRSNECNMTDLSTCTGHIADYPCTWTSSTESQTYHLQIPLQSKGTGQGGRGYSYTQLNDMWRAANATKSNLLMYWWSPHALMEEFVGSDAEFQPVLLPTPTQQCIEARHTGIQRCSENITDRVGPPETSCDEQPRSLLKVASTTLYDMSYNPSIPEALRHPAHDVLDRFTLSTLQLGEIFYYWSKEPTLRQGLCRWASDNIDYLQRFVPPTHPRVIHLNKNKNQALMYSAIGLASGAALLSLLTAGMVYRHREHRVIKYAQVEFLYLLLAGLVLVSAGAILDAVSPTNGTCLASVWLVNLGYALVLVPHIIKVAAINALAKAAKKMKRVELKREMLFKAVFVICGIVVIFLVFWSILLPPHKEPEYDLTTDLTEDGSTIVGVTYSCNSDNEVFQYIAVGGTLLLLLWASVLAIQNRSVRQDFNESQTLGIMVYSHVVFTTLRLVTILLPKNNDLSGSTLAEIRCIIFSNDVITTIIIYFIPKLLSHDEAKSSRNVGSDGSRDVDNASSSTHACRRESTMFATIIRPTEESPLHMHEQRAMECECPNCGKVAEMSPLMRNIEQPSDGDLSVPGLAPREMACSSEEAKKESSYHNEAILAVPSERETADSNAEEIVTA